MSSNTVSSRKYANLKIGNLLERMASQSKTHEQAHLKKIKQDIAMHRSFSLTTPRYSDEKKNPYFNHHTKDGKILDEDIKPLPYVFIPKFKNDFFIMPDRVFQKGQAGKRFVIKMKDSTITSFRNNQNSKMCEVLNQNEKQKTIVSRRMEQYNQIVNVNDGKVRADHNRWFLKTRKRINPTNTAEYFNQFDPLLEPKQSQTLQIRKISLAKTFDFRKTWRPITRNTENLRKTQGTNIFKHHHAASVL